MYSQRACGDPEFAMEMRSVCEHHWDATYAHKEVPSQSVSFHTETLSFT